MSIDWWNQEKNTNWEEQEVCQSRKEIKKRMANQANKQERSVNWGERVWQIKKSNSSVNLANKREEEVGQLTCRRTEVCCWSLHKKEEEKVHWLRRATEVCRWIKPTKKPIEKSKRSTNWGKKYKRNLPMELKSKRGQPMRATEVWQSMKPTKNANQEEQEVCQSRQEIKKGWLIKLKSKRGQLIKAREDGRSRRATGLSI